MADDLSICNTCGTQYDVTYANRPKVCRMCLDPRQFVLPSGHSFSSLTEMRKSFKNKIIPDAANPHVWSIVTEPQFAIGQRAVFIQTPNGNVLWDCIALLDQETIDFVRSKGGVKAIGISHPHFYSSHLEWARVFDCKVYVAQEDEEWLNREDKEGRRVLVKENAVELLPGVTMVKLGGHFPGSSVLHWDDNLFTGDTIGISLSGLSREHHTPEHQTFFFHYAFPNFIPLGPTAMQVMWQRLRPYDFTTLFSLFDTRTVRDKHAKKIVLESMQRQARHQENDGHSIFTENWD